MIDWQSFHLKNPNFGLDFSGEKWKNHRVLTGVTHGHSVCCSEERKYSASGFD
jgi:hypothetical protein